VTNEGLVDPKITQLPQAGEPGFWWRNLFSNFQGLALEDEEKIT
jgi:hypothetical protein